MSKTAAPTQARSTQLPSQNIGGNLAFTHILWSIMSGASFYGLSYFFFVRGGTQFFPVLFVSLLVLGAIIGVLTLWGSSWMKSLLLRGESMDARSVLGSITLGRVTFLFFVPLVVFVGVLHFNLGLYLVGMALVAQKLVESVSLAMARDLPFSQSLFASLIPAFVWFIPLLFFF